jgi:hypothetical protein
VNHADVRGKKHPNYGKKHPRINIGKNNGQWKGDDVSYKSLHEWVSNHLTKPNKCPGCGKIKKARTI